MNKDSITTSASSHVRKIVRPCIFICLLIYIFLHFKSKLVCDVPSLNLTQLNVWYAKYPLTMPGITFGWPSSEIDLDWLYVLLKGLNDLFVGQGYSNTEKKQICKGNFASPVIMPHRPNAIYQEPLNVFCFGLLNNLTWCRSLVVLGRLLIFQICCLLTFYYNFSSL